MLRRARIIPKTFLERETGKNGKKDDLIRDLFLKDPDKLEGMSIIFQAKKNKFGGFLFEIPKGPKISFRNEQRALAELNNSMHSDPGEDLRMEVLRVAANQNEVILSVRYETNPHIDNQWTGEPHTHPDIRHAIVSFRFDLGGATIRARSRTGAVTCMRRLAKIIFGSEERVKMIVLETEEERQRVLGKTKAKKAVVTDLKLPGTERIMLSGEDVEETLDLLKKEYDLDLRRMGSATRFDKFENLNEIKMLTNGRIVIPGGDAERNEMMRKVFS